MRKTLYPVTAEALDQQLANAAAELTAVLVVAERRGFLRGRRTESVELLAEMSELQRVSAEWIRTDDERSDAEILALIGKFQRVTGLAADAIRFA
jgi:hypothetical protein